MKKIIMILSVLWLFSCSNPSDIDTPRSKDYEDPSEYRKFPASSVTLTVSGDKYDEFFKSRTEIIIKKGKVYLTIDSGYGRVPETIENDKIISGITLFMDSLAFEGEKIDIIGGEDVSPGAEVLFLQNQYNFYDTSVIPDGVNNRLSITLSADTLNRTITGNLDMILSPYGRAYPPESGILIINY